MDPRFTKSLAELEPPTFDLTTPHRRWTAHHQMINWFLWATEAAYATVLQDYDDCNDDSTPACNVLEHTPASACLDRSKKGRPHLTSGMGSFLVQLRWAPDGLGRYCLIDLVGALDAFLRDRLDHTGISQQHRTNFPLLWKELNKLGIPLDAYVMYRAWLCKEIRNDVVHVRTTLHTFARPDLRNSLRHRTRSADSWSSDPEWPAHIQKGLNWILESTRMRADKFDTPQLFYLAVAALDEVDKFVNHVHKRLGDAGF